MPDVCRKINKRINPSVFGGVPHWSKTEGHKQQEGHDTHRPLVIYGVAALKTKTKR